MAMTAEDMAQPVIFSIGHSTHAYERFLELVRQAGVTAIADVRSAPFSRRAPQFNQDALRQALRRDGLAYVYLGEALGGRPAARRYYHDGVVDYERMADSAAFRRGLERLLDGARTYRIALMCSEQEPLDCHRCLLIGRALSGDGVAVRHILADGAVLDHAEAEARLMALEGREGGDLFLSRGELLAHAYRRRARRAGHAGPDMEGAVNAKASLSA